MDTLKILIPTDFSVQAEFAYLMVKKLEEKIPLEIHFAHILSVPDTVTIDEVGKIQTCGEIDGNFIQQQADIAQRKLANLKTLYGEHIHTHLKAGKVTDVILDFSEQQKFDLIVMGTKGAWGLKEKLSGSETQIIGRKSRIPLLSLMCDRSDLNIKNLLLVHDFNHPEEVNLSLLQKFIKYFGVTVHMLQITSGNSDEVRNSIESGMQQFATINHIPDFKCHVIHDKNVENGVVHFNQMNNMDIVCIGTHGKGGLFHHSATEALINHMFKPIISFQLN